MQIQVLNVDKGDFEDADMPTQNWFRVKVGEDWFDISELSSGGIQVTTNTTMTIKPIVSNCIGLTLSKAKRK